MGRKSKAAGGNFPLTHYERTQKFASSEYGTVRTRVAGDSQYRLGDCALSLASLKPSTATTTTTTTTSIALCTASGYLYAKDAIYTYLLEQTQELKQQREAWEQRQHAQAEKAAADADKKRKADFEASQKLIMPSGGAPKRTKLMTQHQKAKEDLKRTSYWLADSQPEVAATAAATTEEEPPPTRPLSPHSQTPLRRKDLWPVELRWSSPDESSSSTLICSVSEKPLHTQAVIAYWTSNSDKDQYPGQLVLQQVYDQVIEKEGGRRCPHTGRKIKQTRPLQRAGTSFAAGGQAVTVQKYRPTIT